MALAATVVPALGWLRSYQRGWLRYDLVAGGTLAAYLIPSAIGDASLAGLPAQAGLYACLFSALVYWMFSGSRHTAMSGMSQSLVNESSGGRTPLSTLVAAGIVLVATLFLSGLLADQPVSRRSC